MSDAKTTIVHAVEVFRHAPRPCRHCGNVYEHKQRILPDDDGGGCCGGDLGPLVHCPACGCPAEEPGAHRHTGELAYQKEQS